MWSLDFSAETKLKHRLLRCLDRTGTFRPECSIQSRFVRRQSTTAVRLLDQHSKRTGYACSSCNTSQVPQVGSSLQLLPTAHTFFLSILYPPPIHALNYRVVLIFRHASLVPGVTSPVVYKFVHICRLPCAMVFDTRHPYATRDGFG